ncbi:hypothetical protein K469DRAFT_800038 [Zopfia rhizophila CBS 207.26]|uniref:Tc1-like transposase DDE domain-containing protein n=1 Tax=Zopfia rhizophila CBS 207.26 TaxID=1314779 RepID=A0A6A6EQD5_9PEZI|nr:hypothetical protein K469DRAFT_800038 [Zopfia rhizophila CBS 207.26]
MNLSKRVIISEDSTPPHIKARRLFKVELEEKGVEFVQWPAKSPDIHPIDDIQKQNKNLDEVLFKSIQLPRRLNRRPRMRWSVFGSMIKVFTKIVEDISSMGKYMRLGLLARQHG